MDVNRILLIDMIKDDYVDLIPFVNMLSFF